MTVTHASKKTTAAPLWRGRKHFMWFPFSFTIHEVKNDRIYVQKGLFTTTYNESLLYRVTDIKLTRSIAQNCVHP